MKFLNNSAWTSDLKKKKEKKKKERKKEKYHPQNLCNNKASILRNNCVARSPHNGKKILATVSLKGEPIATLLTYWHNYPSKIKLYCLVTNVNKPSN